MVAAETRSYRVTPSDTAKRLDQCIADAHPEFTRSRIKLLFLDGKILVEGRPAKASHRVRVGETIIFLVPLPPPLEVTPQNIPLSILYEDAELIVVDKPAGMVTHPGAGNWDKTLINGILFRFQEVAGLGSSERPGLVHRLDKDTSGCMVVAKTDQSLQFLQSEFKARRVQKTYRTLVLGVPPVFERIETFYGRHPGDRKKFTGKVSTGRTAITEYRLRESFVDASELEVNLMTGRTHQIRVHLAERGFPILGDAVYGRLGGRQPRAGVAPIAEKIGRQALHAWQLRFEHPSTHQQVTFQADLPPDYLSALKELRGVTGWPEST